MKRTTLTTLAAAVLCGLLVAGPSRAELSAKANHDHITVDFLYHGSSVSVRGIADPGVDLIIKIASADGHETLKEKGKKAGLLWMNVGSLTFENAPKVYEVFSTRPSRELLSAEEADRYVLGYAALSRHVEVGPLASEQERAKWFAEFLKFKEASNLYARTTGQITFAEKNGKREYYINTPWPYQAPPGNYVATVYAVQDGKVVETAESGVLVEQVGSIKYLASLAKNQAALYGLLSIMAALGAGFGVGLVFRKGGGAH
ncbi:MAG TPA: TIGR02186 family protein [bacterium]